MKPIINIILVTTLLIITSCVQEEHLKTVAFKVDMNQIENVAQVGVRGPFTANPWKETIYLEDINNDGIYEGTIEQKTAQNQVEFKFVNLNDQFELKNQDTRIINFEYKAETILYQAIFNNPKGSQTSKN
jgi:hypothetical protein